MQQVPRHQQGPGSGGTGLGLYPSSGGQQYASSVSQQYASSGGQQYASSGGQQYASGGGQQYASSGGQQYAAAQSLLALDPGWVGGAGWGWGASTEINQGL